VLELSVPFVTGSPFLPRRGFEELAPCCVWPVAERAYASGRSDIKSVAVRTAASDVRTALNFILELQWFDSKRERVACAIGRLSSGGVRFDVGASLFKPLILDVSRFRERSLKCKFF
jgi:hypothetical protein